MKLKTIKIISIFLCAIIIALPVVGFNFKENAVSAIDNRTLAPWPLSEKAGGDLTENIENYINDRIGFRDKMIRSYTVLNDRLFHKMVHPSYVYGKDGYVFGAGMTVYDEFSQYHVIFADMVKKIQDYCEDRGVPFVFVFNPAKPAVYSEYIADGFNYNRSWVPLFLQELDARGIHYVDNTETMLAKKQEGVAVFNQKYDASHWNDLGAFYGVNAILEALNRMDPRVHVNSEDEFFLSNRIETSLPVSDFPIHEEVPVVDYRSQNSISRTGDYEGELELDPVNSYFFYTENPDRAEDSGVRCLVFQGSYMNGYGYKSMVNSFSEYIAVHDYQNVINFPYYFNIFKPDCVVFEVAEYTFDDHYFDHEKMQAISYNMPFEQVESEEILRNPLNTEEIVVEQGETLTKIQWNTSEQYDCGWMFLGEEYDLIANENGYTVTVPTDVYRQFSDSLSFAGLAKEKITIWELGEIADNPLE